MKKPVLTVAAIAVAFAGLAFIPAQKNNALDEAVISTDAEGAKAGRCEKNFESDVSFTKCSETWTEDSAYDAEDQADILDKY